MELKKESQKVIYENIKEVLLDLQKDVPNITDEVVNKLLSAFKEVVSLGDTSFISLLASMCVESLDAFEFLGFVKGYIDKDRSEVFKQNTVLYSTMNSLETN